MNDFTFWLGVHMPTAMGRTNVPLMVSRRILSKRRRLPIPQGPIIIDSGGFTELSLFGGWRTTVDQYVSQIRRIDSEIPITWVAPMDWMCEPPMLAKTGADVFTHIQRTVSNYLTLRDTAPEIPWIPVLQGWAIHEYHLCADLYEREGMNLIQEPVIGLGSVCRRQATLGIEIIVRSLAARGYRLHGFGMKRAGIKRCADVLASADSMAWSYEARWNPPLLDHTHKSCANCLVYALQWRSAMLQDIRRHRAHPHQLPFLMVG